MFQDNELLLQFRGNLYHRRQHDDECPILFAFRNLLGQRLDDLGAAQESVEVPQHQ